MEHPTGYGVNITSITYGDTQLLELGARGQPAGGTMGVFDSGSTCLNLPRGLFNGYYKSSLFDNFAAAASTNPTLPIVVTLNDRVRLEIPQVLRACVHACVHACMQIFVTEYVRTYGCMPCTHTCIHTRVCVRTCIHACLLGCMHAYIHTHMHACMHTYIHTYTHTHIHTYIHTYMA